MSALDAWEEAGVYGLEQVRLHHICLGGRVAVVQHISPPLTPLLHCASVGSVRSRIGSGVSTGGPRHDGPSQGSTRPEADTIRRLP